MNPYHVLGVDSSAHTDELKKAYKSLCQKLHPDNQETGDATQFNVVQAAYNVVGNPIMRKHYDETGLTEMLRPVEDRVDDALASLMNQVVIKILNPQPVINRQTGQQHYPELDFTVSFVEECKKKVREDIRTLNITDQGLSEAIMMVEEMQKRITTTRETNVFEQVLEEKIRRMQYQLNINKDTHNLFAALLEALDEYGDIAVNH